MVISKTLRFIDGNFRAGGWQGKSFQRWKENAKRTTTLVKTGKLRRSFNVSKSGDSIKFYSNMKYASIHNRGFSGNIQIAAHKRSKYGQSVIMAVNDFTKSGRRKSKTVTNKIGESEVRAHTRKVNIVQRQFAPIGDGSDSPVLIKSITRELERETLKILNR